MPCARAKSSQPCGGVAECSMTNGGMVEREKAFDRRPRGEGCTNVLVSRTNEPLTQGRLLDQALELVREILRIPISRDQPGNAIADDLGNSSRRCANHGATSEERLAEDEAEPLLPTTRWQHHDGTLAIFVRHRTLPDEVRPTHRLTKAELRRCHAQLLFVRAFPENLERTRHAAREQTGVRVEQDVDSLR